MPFTKSLNVITGASLIIVLMSILIAGTPTLADPSTARHQKIQIPLSVAYQVASDASNIIGQSDITYTSGNYGELTYHWIDPVTVLRAFILKYGAAVNVISSGWSKTYVFEAKGSELAIYLKSSKSPLSNNVSNVSEVNCNIAPNQGYQFGFSTAQWLLKTSTGKPLVYRDAFLVGQADNTPEIMFAPFLDCQKINLNGYCCLSVDVNRKTTYGDPIFWSVIPDKNWLTTTYSNEQQVDTNTGSLKSVKVPLVTDISLSWNPILVDSLDHTPPLAIGLYGSIIDQDSITRTSLGILATASPAQDDSKYQTTTDDVVPLTESALLPIAANASSYIISAPIQFKLQESYDLHYATQNIHKSNSRVITYSNIELSKDSTHSGSWGNWLEAHVLIDGKLPSTLSRYFSDQIFWQGRLDTKLILPIDQPSADEYSQSIYPLIAVRPIINWLEAKGVWLTDQLDNYDVPIVIIAPATQRFQTTGDVCSSKFGSDWFAGTLNAAGIYSYNGQKCLKVMVTDPEGKQVAVLYFNINDGLLQSATATFEVKKIQEIGLPPVSVTGIRRIDRIN